MYKSLSVEHYGVIALGEARASNKKIAHVFGVDSFPNLIMQCGNKVRCSCRQVDGQSVSHSGVGSLLTVMMTVATMQLLDSMKLTFWHSLCEPFMCDLCVFEHFIHCLSSFEQCNDIFFLTVQISD